MKEIGFQIIGLKPLVGCNPKFLKILKADEIYFFHQSFTIESFISNNGEKEEKIESSELLPKDFYSDAKPIINISAIVGANGVGKSTITELLYVGLYNLSRSVKLLDKKDEDGVYYHFEESVKFELYFCHNEIHYKIIFDDLSPEIIEFNKDGVGYNSRKKITPQTNLEQLFYTIVINNSHYALNSEEVGQWVKPIFHKNDAYQTPIVLNPFRKKGNIDINTENYLVRSRLLANIFAYSAEKPESIFLLLNKRNPVNFSFELDRSKFKLKQDGSINFELSNNYGHRVFPVIYELFFGNSLAPVNDTPLNKIAKEYILRKMISIIATYNHYLKYRNFYGKKASRKLRDYVIALKGDKSHITFKLRQAINFLRLDILPKDKEKFELKYSVLKTETKKALEKFKDLEPIEIVPPSFIKVDIEFSSKTDNFSKLSSGEKQKIYSLSSLIYHLVNIDSTHRQKNNTATRTSRPLIKYSFLNIIFDEIELYYHPEFQRTFINDIIKNIEAIKLNYIKGINLIFITHSPFILSDIPKNSILFLELENGFATQKPSYIKKTFAANIHDILASSFFLREGEMGEFVKGKIQKIIDWCSEKDNIKHSDDYSRLIDLIDEPIIKFKLKEMLAEKTGANIEIARLEAQQHYIENRLNELKNDTNKINHKSKS